MPLNVLYHFPFDTEPFIDSVHGSILNKTGTTPEVTDGVFDGAWQMAENCWISSPDSFSVPNGFSIGFWLKSVNPGVVTVPVTNATVSLKMPLFSKATFTEMAQQEEQQQQQSFSLFISPPSYQSSQYSTVNNAVGNVIIAWEETQTSGKNVMKVALRGKRNNVVTISTITTSEYKVGTFNHFWITWDKSAVPNPTLRVYINTIEDTGLTRVGNVPDTLLVSSAPFSLNRSVVGPLYQIARNTGVLDDFVVLSVANNSSATIAKVANKGALYVANENYADIEEIDQAALFDDPGTSQVTSLHPSNGKVYVARSDGELLRGTKLVWESRRDFGNNKESEHINLVNKGEDGYVLFSAGSLSIKNQIVRV